MAPAIPTSPPWPTRTGGIARTFTAPASFAGRRLTLVFDGVDQHGEVWLNGQKIGANTGMFKRFSFDVTAAIKPEQLNQLAVRIGRYPDHRIRTGRSKASS